VEASWLIESRLGPAAEAAFLASVVSGELTRVDLADADWQRYVVLIETYVDLGLGLVDASVVAVAERVGITTLATLNRRDFTVVRPRHVEAFDLIP
jgi:predicted nucleic acid-binding protein